MCRKVKDFPVISGGDKIMTLRDLMEHTPQNQVSKVMLEEKVFKTWYDCRTVLLGDGTLVLVELSDAHHSVRC